MKLINTSTLESSLHPICLLSSTDTQTFSLYYSFFLISLENIKDDTAILFRIPALRDRLDDIESAVKYFVSTSTPLEKDDSFGSFVITTSDGSRYFAAWRAAQVYLLIGVSIFPLISFTRKVFTLIGDEPMETIYPILITLCEYPILGVPSLSYDIRLHSGTITLHFDKLGLVEDEDMDLLASRLLTPQMLFDSWEALILESKVLVISTVPSIVPYCCEYLRRLVLPLVVINTYVPFLPEELLSTIEAPFPYLIGAQTDQVYANGVDLSDTYIVDLDQRRVIPPKSASGIALRLPPSVRSKVIQDINEIRNIPLSRYVQRSFDQKESPDSRIHPLYSNSISTTHNSRFIHGMNKHSATLAKAMKNEEHSILECFVRLNLSLFGARYCDIRAFFRRCDRTFAEEGSQATRGFCLPKYKGPDGKNASMGFSRRNGVICGCMQLLNERKDINLLQFLPCWVEFDELVFSVYQFADELPLILILNKDIVAVSPAPVEPEGHVFDIQIINQMTFRFAATDIESRREWIHEIDLISNKSAPSASPLSVQISSTSELESLTESHHSVINDEEISCLSKFRSKIVQTQMISYFKSKSEFQEYESILNEQSLTATDLTTSSVETRAKFKQFHTSTAAATAGPEPESAAEAGVSSAAVAAGAGASSSAATSSSSSSSSSSSAKEETNESSSINRQNLLKRRNSANLTETETLSSDEVIINLRHLWGLYVTGEVDIQQENQFDNNNNNNNSGSGNGNDNGNNNKSQNNESNGLLEVPLACREATLSFLSISPRDYSYLDTIHRKYLQFDSAEKLLLSKKDTGWSKSFFKSNCSPEVESPEITAIKEELNTAIRNELKLREFAGELLQRISATHRQCEADLRKLLVQTKMTTIANIIDVNDHSQHPKPTVLVDIEEVAAELQSDMTSEQRLQLRTNPLRPNTWDEVLKSWSITPCLLLRQSSFDRKSANNLIYPPSQISTDTSEDINTLLETACSHPSHHINMDSLDDLVPVVGNIENNSNVIRVTQHNYKSPEAESIRLGIKNHVVKQLNDCSAEHAPYHQKVLIPVLQGMNGYVCGRLPSEEKEAILAYSESALGDQGRIMRCLVSIFLSYAQTNHHENENQNLTTNPTDSTSSSTEEHPRLLLVPCSQVENFLYWAYSIGDIIGLQAVRLITELLHRCLCGRMKERILEQCEILPLQPHSGERLVSEFKREVAHGIYSRKRLSLSNMQPSFIWVNAALAKKSEVLNELVVCTMSASKPCELSIQLLNSLREILKASYQESLGSTLTENSWGHQFTLSDKERERIKSSSAYRSFEVQSCQLQVSDVTTLDDNSKIVFFCNLYNIITVHSILSRGYAGNGLHDRGNFMKTAKYNINGVIFNLIEIEHHILRSQSASPGFLLGHLISISEKSSKTIYAIHRPIPLVSFALFLACVSSPALTVLWDANSVDAELQRAARSYILLHSHVERSNKTLYLPDLFKWYSKDYGTNSKDILQSILQLIGKDNSLYDEICKYIDPTKPNLAYTPFDWKLQLVI